MVVGLSGGSLCAGAHNLHMGANRVSRFCGYRSLSISNPYDRRVGRSPTKRQASFRYARGASMPSIWAMNAARIVALVVRAIAVCIAILFSHAGGATAQSADGL